MKVALAQIVCEVGNVAANCNTLRRVAKQASGEGCDAVVFPEMSDTGYDMKTIVEKASTWKSGPLQLLQELASQLGIWIVCGLSEREKVTCTMPWPLLIATGSWRRVIARRTCSVRLAKSASLNAETH